MPQVEKSAFCQEVIKCRIADGLADNAPVFSDVEDVHATDLGLDIRALIGGFPCQAWYLQLTVHSKIYVNVKHRIVWFIASYLLFLGRDAPGLAERLDWQTAGHHW